MKSIYDAIKEAQAEIAKERGEDIWNIPAHVQAKDSACRDLDHKLGESFQIPIQMFHDGLISSAEFFELILTEAAKPV